MALQRNLKALGTFGFQTTNRGNPVYIQYIPRTLRYARANLLAQPRFARLHGILAPTSTSCGEQGALVRRLDTIVRVGPARS